MSLFWYPKSTIQHSLFFDSRNTVERNKIVQSITRTLFLAIVAKLLSTIKVSFAIGSMWLFFSLRNCIAPLSGGFGGLLGVSLFFTFNAAAVFLFKGAIPFSYLAYSGIPTFFSSLYWASDSRFMRAVVPAMCMILFWLHPIILGMISLWKIFWHFLRQPASTVIIQSGVN